MNKDKYKQIVYLGIVAAVVQYAAFLLLIPYVGQYVGVQTGWFETLVSPTLIPMFAFTVALNIIDLFVAATFLKKYLARVI